MSCQIESIKFKENLMKKGLMLFAVLSLAISTVAFAEAGSGEKSVTDFFRKFFNYPGKAVQKTGESLSHTANNTGAKVIEPIASNTAEVLQGDLSQTGNIIAEPVVGAAETTGQAVSEAVQIPVQAAQDEPAASTKS